MDYMFAGSTSHPCEFCRIARASTATTLLYADEKVVAFPDIDPSAFRHYLVIPVEHIPTVDNLKRRSEDHDLVSHMLKVGQDLLRRNAPESNTHRWRYTKYSSDKRFPGFIEAEKLLEDIKPLHQQRQ